MVIITRNKRRLLWGFTILSGSIVIECSKNALRETKVRL